ncbi:MAG: aminotransferase class I/II-fold pyridoxal phosphate-dependent enzyme [Candidatus Sericytochromatia bacterium]|nr:aminotransferase class I/II-fold pyridoxal phosphate-dependent enzyme [Candidatus Sericytochromatia bacterium]
MRKAADYLDACDRSLGQAAQRGLMYRTAEDQACDGRLITLDGEPLLQFASGSYLGLEMDPRLKAGAIDAIQRYGTQFPSSRAFVSAPLYAELEERLGAIFGTPTLATASSTLAHLAAIPVLVNEDDAVLIDQQVHATVQSALNHVRVHGVPVEVLRHNRLDLLEARVLELSRRYRRVWYMADGVYSMFGDVAPMPPLMDMLERHPALHFYLDDAHGMSWTGQRGRGHVLEALPAHPRLYVATSLAKSFSSGGGALIIPDAELRRKIRTVGPSLIFSGPLQPANLGAAIASAEIHLSEEIAGLQADLRTRLEHCNARCLALGLPLLSTDLVPIRFIATGLPRASYELVERLKRDGFYGNTAVFPAVPMQRAGLRFTITCHQQLADIDAFLAAVARHLPEVLEAEGSSLEEVFETFEIPTKRAIAAADVPPVRESLGGTGGAGGAFRVAPENLRVRHVRTIGEVDAAVWDACFGRRGSFSHEGLRCLEAIFAEAARPEHRWNFHYLWVEDAEGRIVAASFFTDALWKDDMLAPAPVSREAEALRRTDPLALSSRYFAMGSLLTEGEHLYLDRQRDWRAALQLLLREAARLQRASEADHLVVRDVPDADHELSDWLSAAGFVRFAMPEVLVQTLDWQDEAAWLASLSKKARRHVRKEVLGWRSLYEARVYGQTAEAPGAARLAHCHALYRQLQQRQLEINTFELPDTTLPTLLASPAWELVTLRKRPSPEQPDPPEIGMFVSFIGPEAYVPVFAGLDDAHVGREGLYRQVLWQIIQRARHHGARQIRYGIGATLEKRRVGAQVQHVSLWLQSRDLYAMERVGHMMRDVRPGAV